MKTLQILAAFAALSFTACAAQAQAPAPVQAQPSAKDARIQCRVTAKVRGLRGAERKASVADCMAQLRPASVAKDACRAKGRTEGLKGKPLKAFVRECRTAKG